MTRGSVLFVSALLMAAALASTVNADTIDKTTIEIIQMEGYTAESHYVITADGYILNLHRINGGLNGEITYLQHGILGSSFDWVAQGAAKSLGFYLVNNGYDVWLGNARGNTYSRNHTTLNPETDPRFWDFTFHEMGIYDLPAAIDYIMGYTEKEGVYFVGHSQGNTAFSVMVSNLPQYNTKIRAAFYLAPVAFMSHCTSLLLRTIAALQVPEAVLISLIGSGEFLPSTQLIASACQSQPAGTPCTNPMYSMCGYNPNEMNTTLEPTIAAHTPAGTSSKNILHYAQLVNSARFRQYNYGFIGNTIRYNGSQVPPEYSLGNVRAPTYFFYAGNDWLSAVVDADRLYEILENRKHKYLVTETTFSDLDFIYGMHARELVYPTILSELSLN